MNPVIVAYVAMMDALLLGGAYFLPGPDPAKWFMIGLAGFFAAVWLCFAVADWWKKKEP